MLGDRVTPSKTVPIFKYNELSGQFNNGEKKVLKKSQLIIYWKCHEVINLCSEELIDEWGTAM